jgi:hypothetical protein
MAVGAAAHTGVHLATNDFTFNNWNWGSFAGSVVAGGVGGGVSFALANAGIGGFAGGAITGGASGFSQNLTSSLINGDLTAGGLAKSTFLGAGIGGLIGGIDATIKGNRFIDGRSKVTSERFITDEKDLIVKDGDYRGFERDSYNNSTRSYKGSENHPSSRKININKGFEGDLTVDLDILPQKGESYFFEVDEKNIFQASSRYKGSFSFSGNSKNIHFGIKGAYSTTGTNIGNNVVAGVGAHPASWTKIYGTWRGFGGFLWYP